MTLRTGIIAASATSAAPASAATARCGGNFAAGNAEPGRVFIRLRRKPGLIELGRMRLRRGGGPLGRLILCARFRGITHRRIVRRLRRHGLNGFRVLVLGRPGFERGGEKLFAGNQRGNEERPGQETERARSLVRTLHPCFEDLLLLFEQFALFYVVHDRRLSSRSTQTFHLVPLKNNSRPAAFTAGRVFAAHQASVSCDVSVGTSKCPTSK